MKKSRGGLSYLKPKNVMSMNVLVANGLLSLLNDTTVTV